MPLSWWHNWNQFGIPLLGLPLEPVKWGSGPESPGGSQQGGYAVAIEG